MPAWLPGLVKSGGYGSMEIQKRRGKQFGKIDSDETDRPETSEDLQRFKRFSPDLIG